METWELIQSIGVAVGLGLLVGLQRESREKDSKIAGIRTFALISLLGSMAGLIGPGAVAVGMAGVIVFFVLGNLARYKKGENKPGMTTEFAALVMFAVGAAAALGYTASAVVVGGLTAVLLYFKPQLHGMVGRVGQKDFRGIFQLALIGLVILPVMPDQTYGPYDVLNPYKIWLMVVLIVGISLAAYAAYRLLGEKVGSVLGGVLGGFISSTATTVSYARQTASNPSAAPMAAMVVLIASTIVNIRVLIEIGAVAPGFLKTAIWPIAAMTGVMFVVCGVLFAFAGKQDAIKLDHDNPAQLNAALVFGGLYAVILFIVAAVKENFGEEALYVVAIISGLTDMDAITLSTANMVSDERVAADTGWRVVLVAGMSNMVFKGIAAAVLGNRRLGVWVGAAFGVCIAGGLAIVLLWPHHDAGPTQPGPATQQVETEVDSKGADVGDDDLETGNDAPSDMENPNGAPSNATAPKP